MNLQRGGKGGRKVRAKGPVALSSAAGPTRSKSPVQCPAHYRRVRDRGEDTRGRWADAPQPSRKDSADPRGSCLRKRACDSCSRTSRAAARLLPPVVIRKSHAVRENWTSWGAILWGILRRAGKPRATSPLFERELELILVECSCKRKTTTRRTAVAAVPAAVVPSATSWRTRIWRREKGGITVRGCCTSAYPYRLL